MSDYKELKKEWEEKYGGDLDHLTKGCIVVGCAPSVLLNKWGPIIDQFKTVVRLNSYKIKGYEEHVGTKTDIWARAKNYEIAFRDGTQFREVWIKQKWDRTRRDGPVYQEIGPPILNMDQSYVRVLPERQFKRKSDGRLCNWTTGYLAVITAMEGHQAAGLPTTTYGFTFFGGDDSKPCPRPHYYREEPPSLFDGFSHDASINSWMAHANVEEREDAIHRANVGQINLLFPEEVFETDKLELSHLKEIVRVTPEHLANLPENLRVKYV